MSVKVNIPEAKIAIKYDQKWKKHLGELTSIILDDANEYCKFDKGTLAQSALIHSIPSEGRIIWQTPYARRQYWEIRTAHTDMNTKATWKWFEAAKAANKEQWTAQAEKLMEG